MCWRCWKRPPSPAAAPANPPSGLTTVTLPKSKSKSKAASPRHPTITAAAQHPPTPVSITYTNGVALPPMSLDERMSIASKISGVSGLGGTDVAGLPVQLQGAGDRPPSATQATAAEAGYKPDFRPVSPAPQRAAPPAELADDITQSCAAWGVQGYQCTSTSILAPIPSRQQQVGTVKEALSSEPNSPKPSAPAAPRGSSDGAPASAPSPAPPEAADDKAGAAPLPGISKKASGNPREKKTVSFVSPVVSATSSEMDDDDSDDESQDAPAARRRAKDKVVTEDDLMSDGSLHHSPLRPPGRHVTLSGVVLETDALSSSRDLNSSGDRSSVASDSIETVSDVALDDLPRDRNRSGEDQAMETLRMKRLNMLHLSRMLQTGHTDRHMR